MKDRVFTGASVEEALDFASRALGVSQDELSYIVIDQGRSSTTLRTEKPVMIAVLADAVQSLGQRTTARSPDELLSEALRALTHASGVSLSARISRSEESLEVTLSSEDEDFIWGDNGEVFDALNLLLRRMVSRTGHRGTICVTNRGVLERRRARLERRAREAAERVRNEGMPLILSGLNSFERRVVHLALAGCEGVRTRSEGEDDSRQLVIEPFDGEN